MNQIPDSVFNAPRSSFMTPVPVPLSDPDKGTIYFVAFSVEWLPYVLGCLWQLWQPTTWQSDDPAIVQLAINRAVDLTYLFTLAAPYIPQAGFVGVETEDIMIRQSPTNPCLFETSVNGTDWCVWADISKCGNFGSQPGGGSSQPSAGGGIVSNCVTLQTSGQLLLQAPVTTGDTIEITSADGAGNDGTLPIWWCPDGSEYFAGLCTPLSSMVSTDPLPATQHMTLIVIIGGVPYPLYPGGVFTVPGGISLAQAVIQVNNAPLSDGSGSYNICYKQTNNQAASWCHTFDFRISKYGTIDAGSAGGAATWIPGIGWQHPGGGGNNNFISLTPGGSFTVTRIAAVFNTNGGVACGSCECEIFAPYPTVYPGADIIPISAGDNHLDASNTLTISSISLDANDGTATLLTWSSLTVYGKGFDPFTAVPVC